MRSIGRSLLRLSDVDCRNPADCVIVVTLLAAIALMATYLPARRAAHIAPLAARRQD
jgi:ABC-type lipoprotein release transport system permease subunit